MSHEQDPGAGREPRRDPLDERLDDVLRDLRGSYNVPPVPPLDAMWARIDQSLQPAAGPAVGSADPTPLHLVRAARPAGAARLRRLAPWIGIAAALLVGVGVGRATARPGVVRVPVYVAAAGGTDVTKPRPASSGLERAAPSDVETGTRVAVAPARSTPRSAGLSAAPVRALLASTAAAADAETGDESGAGPVAVGSTGRYLGQATALLIALANEAPRPGDDARLARRAGELLTTTRLLLDSPSTTQESRALLEDLELVLSQVVRFHSASGREDLQLIREALEQRDLLPRLHTAVVGGSDD